MLGSLVITPSAMLNAPAIHALTQYGSSQCLHETAKLILLSPSTVIRGRIFTSFNALEIPYVKSGLEIPELAKAQLYSQR